MPRLEFSELFAEDLASVTSKKVEQHILSVLDCLEQYGEFGSAMVRPSIQQRFGNVRRVPVDPFDLLYTYYPDEDLVRVEALVAQRGVI